MFIEIEIFIGIVLKIIEHHTQNYLIKCVAANTNTNVVYPK
jgi:hypothetical protein